ncbi:MAG TPA: glutamate-5-semialdehyde dehydrogenase [Firmicutes bacterium]|nr:glutamate-5-semialdehyde dehydrogenase [Bacillota bacterium]
MDLRTLAAGVKEAQLQLGAMREEEKNRILLAVKEALLARQEEIVAANREDVAQAKAESLPAPLLKRLHFDEKALVGVCAGIDSVIALPDPVGRILSARRLDEGLDLYQVSCPIGVIGMIFESRPDALVQIATLCLKSGNGVILKGGSEAARTNRILASTIHDAAVSAGAPPNCLALVESREQVKAMLALDDLIDLLIPRGSNEFVKYIMNNTSIPVLGHADGICHMFIDKEADIDMAVKLVADAKMQYPAVCNALETLLVDREIAPRVLPPLAQKMASLGTELRGCSETAAIIPVKPAGEEDWSTEYLAPILSIKVVGGLDEAINHINKYGSGHTDAIVTQNKARAERFMSLVDSAGVYWNCSTRFADGFRYGLGAEVGISTNKIHARGPVGLEGLVIYKWRLYGSGQVVADYSGEHARSYLHQPIMTDHQP